ncbi:hypothetical protein HXA35_20375 [Bacillus sp. A301a_S52]|nr:hypothetical protein [Bacillus sp. A301a_S52]
MNFEKENYKGAAEERRGDYDGIIVSKDGEEILSLRLSGTAIAAYGDTGLSKDLNPYEWLWETALTFIDEIKERKTLVIMAVDVRDGVLVTPWEELKEEKNSV